MRKAPLPFTLWPGDRSALERHAVHAAAVGDQDALREIMATLRSRGELRPVESIRATAGSPASYLVDGMGSHSEVAQPADGDSSESITSASCIARNRTL
jgi:hypothetical protein